MGPHSVSVLECISFIHHFHHGDWYFSSCSTDKKAILSVMSHSVWWWHSVKGLKIPLYFNASPEILCIKCWKQTHINMRMWEKDASFIHMHLYIWLKL